MPVGLHIALVTRDLPEQNSFVHNVSVPMCGITQGRRAVARRPFRRAEKSLTGLRRVTLTGPVSGAPGAIAGRREARRGAPATAPKRLLERALRQSCGGRTPATLRPREGGVEGIGTRT